MGGKYNKIKSSKYDKEKFDKIHTGKSYWIAQVVINH